MIFFHLESQMGSRVAAMQIETDDHYFINFLVWLYYLTILPHKNLGYHLGWIFTITIWYKILINCKMKCENHRIRIGKARRSRFHETTTDWIIKNRKRSEYHYFWKFVRSMLLVLA